MSKKTKNLKFELQVAKNMVLDVKNMKTIEDVGTSMYESGQQLVLAVEMILKNQFGFDEKQLKKLEKELYHVMMVTKYVEDRDLSVMSHYTMEMVANIAQKRTLDKFKENPSAMFLPTGEIKKNRKGEAVIKKGKNGNVSN